MHAVVHFYTAGAELTAPTFKGIAAKERVKLFLEISVYFPL